MTETEKCEKLEAYLDQNRGDFMNDPEDSSFWVHRRIIESIQTAHQRRGKMCRRPFQGLKESFFMHAMAMQPGDQLEWFPNNLPAVERVIFIKGDDLFVAGLQEAFPWE